MTFSKSDSIFEAYRTENQLLKAKVQSIEELIGEKELFEISLPYEIQDESTFTDEVTFIEECQYETDSQLDELTNATDEAFDTVFQDDD